MRRVARRGAEDAGEKNNSYIIMDYGLLLLHLLLYCFCNYNAGGSFSSGSMENTGKY